MSADNRICIMHYLGDWYVWHGSMSGFYSSPRHGAQRFEKEENALKYADILSSECFILEGGVQIINKEEQINALIDNLRSDLESLYRLHKIGKQDKFNREGEFIECEVEKDTNFSKLFELMENLGEIKKL